MKPYLLVLIAAVTVNCLVTAINGETASEALTVPYIDMLLPPFEDKADSGEAATAAKAEINVKAKVTPVSKTTKSKTTTRPTTTTTTTTTKKPIINDVNNNLPALSIEALLPPLFEAKTAEEATTETTTKGTTTTRTTTRRPSTTTTIRPTTKKTTTKTTTTLRPITTTTTLKPTKATKIQVSDLLLDPLLPPLVDNEIVTKDEVAATTTTQRSLIKTTKKSYYQQQQQQQLKQLPVDNKKDLKNFNALKSGLKPIDKHDALTKAQTNQLTLPSNIEFVTQQYVDKQTTASQEKHVSSTTSKYNNKQHNYSFDLYFGLTTPRPAKNGLPTITPFPHRLGR